MVEYKNTDTPVSGFGAAVSAAGPFYEQDVNQTNHWVGPESDVKEGWPLWDKRMTFASVPGFYGRNCDIPGTNFGDLKQYNCDSVISGIPHPLGLHIQVGQCMLNATVDPHTISNYTQTLSFKNGLTNWKYTWSPENCGQDFKGKDLKFDIEYESFASRARPMIGATQLKVTPRGDDDVDVKIFDVLDGRSAKRSNLVRKPRDSTREGLAWFGVLNGPEGMSNGVQAATLSMAILPEGGKTDKYDEYLGPERTALPSKVPVRVMPNNDSPMTYARSWNVTLTPGETKVFQKVVGMSSTDAALEPALWALKHIKNAAHTGYNGLLWEHMAAWSEDMAPELISSYRDPATGKLPNHDPIVEKLQIAAVADRYYMMQNLLPEDYFGQYTERNWNVKNQNKHGLSVGGLTSDTYGGMLFWDQDTWMFPGIAISNPKHALQIINSRLYQWEDAKLNAQAPNVQAKYKFANGSALYPWVTGRTARETPTGPAFDYQYHINTDIALMMLQYRQITGGEQYFKEKLWPVVKSVGQSIATLLAKDEGRWSIKYMTDPDEYANNVDDGAYTLASFSKVMQAIVKYQAENDMKIDTKWADIAENVAPLRAESGITKEFAAMKDDVVIKQAAVSLLTYPLNFDKDYNLANKRKDLYYYSHKQTPDGPAMSTAIAAISESLVAESGCSAYTLDLESKFPNYRAPWFQMSEQSNDDPNANGGVPPAFPFLTGHGGSLQVNPFGYLGLDLMHDNLTIRPSLPWPLQHLQIQDFWYKGHRIRAALNSTHTRVTRLDLSDTDIYDDAIVVVEPSSAPITLQVGTPSSRRTPEFHELALGATVVVQNDMYWQTIDTAGNMLQCRPTHTVFPTVAGQFASAATDGNSATKWQPLSRNASTLVVDLSSAPISAYSRISFNWGSRPASYARVGFSDSRDAVPTVFVERAIGVELPFESGRTAGEAVEYRGNTTTWEFEVPQRGGRFAWLEIEGCNGCEGDLWGHGATVGEFEVVGV